MVRTTHPVLIALRPEIINKPATISDPITRTERTRDLVMAFEHKRERMHEGRMPLDAVLWVQAHSDSIKPDLAKPDLANQVPTAEIHSVQTQAIQTVAFQTVAIRMPAVQMRAMRILVLMATMAKNWSIKMGPKVQEILETSSNRSKAIARRSVRIAKNCSRIAKQSRRIAKHWQKV